MCVSIYVSHDNNINMDNMDNKEYMDYQSRSPGLFSV